jgi:hypothetical protein
MKNLVFVAAGDTSLHQHWLYCSDFDVYINYYGDVTGRYEKDGQFYSTFKGTKYKILLQALEANPDLFNNYQNIWVPDDDIYLDADGVSKMFNSFKEFDLMLGQPGIIGFISIPISAAVPFSRVRFTNWVEIMCPIFSRVCLQAVKHTFTENESHWGIEFIWNMILGNPTDKIGIIDETPAVHTRACFHGDNYYRNNLTYEFSIKEANKVCAKYNLSAEYKVHKYVTADFKKFFDMPSRDKFLPNIPKLRDIIEGMRGRKVII